MSSHTSLWLRWKMLKLPWRKSFLVGQDLHGNTFWEFRPTLSTTRLRRIVRPVSASLPVSDLIISPQWHQWLRYTRPHAPTLSEQRAEVGRQDSMRVLAKEADERWKKKPSLLDKPVKDGRREGENGGEGGGMRAEEQKEIEARKGQGRSSGSGEGWQPEAWMPKPLGKR